MAEYQELDAGGIPISFQFSVFVVEARKSGVYHFFSRQYTLEQKCIPGVCCLGGGKGRIFYDYFLPQHGSPWLFQLCGNGNPAYVSFGAGVCDLFLWMSGEEKKVQNGDHGGLFCLDSAWLCRTGGGGAKSDARFAIVHILVT